MPDPFNITAGGKTRRVDLRSITFITPDDDPVSCLIKAETWLPDSTAEVDLQRSRLRGATFEQSEIVAAFRAQATSMSLSLTPTQVGELILGAAERMVRSRFAD